MSPIPSSGYSGTPLLQKLGIKEDSKLLLIGQPKNYYELLGLNVESQICKPLELPDIVHIFVQSMEELDAEIKRSGRR